MLLKKSAIATALLCSTAFGLATAAQATTTFSYTGAIQTYTITATGIYDVTLAGGQGGPNNGSGGGAGAFVRGDVSLTAGTVLNIVVGGQGIDGHNYPGAWASSGGGGTFLYTSGPTLLAVAGGGGGADLGSANGQPGAVGAPGAGNGGAATIASTGGGGAGWLGNGATYPDPFDSSGGGGSSYPSFAGGAAGIAFGGGPVGAYGGGGAGGNNFGGGGGGYTGGDASHADGNGGWGGTSYLASGFTNVIDMAGDNFGNGYITLSPVTVVPETSTWVMMLAGFAGLGLAGYRRSKAALSA